MTKPLVTISIPTFNSAKTLARCLDAIKKQTYKNIEINVMDKCSSDETVEVAKKHKVGIVERIEGSLLEARRKGARLARGKYVLILDSDQILEKDAIEEAINHIEKKKIKMIALEESVFSKNTFIEKLFDCDRRLINRVCDLSPHTGVIMPRFFEKSLLLAAYASIPEQMYKNSGGGDHAIVYYEACKLSNKVGVSKNAVKHLEPKTFSEICPKFFRWGYTSIDAHFGKYNKLMKQKERFRRGLFTNGLIVESLGSILLLLLKGVWFKMGYYTGKFDRKFGISRRY